MPERIAQNGQVRGGVRLLIRLEGLALFLTATAAWALAGGGLWPYLLLFFAPDLGLPAYRAGARIGAVVYNALHSLLLPLALIGTDLALRLAGSEAPRMVLLAGLLLLAHAGFDRALGYGLKYASGFADTHLGRIGRK